MDYGIGLKENRFLYKNLHTEFPMRNLIVIKSNTNVFMKFKY